MTRPPTGGLGGHAQKAAPAAVIAVFVVAYLIEMGGPFVGREGVLVVPTIVLMLVMAPFVARSAYTKPPPVDQTTAPIVPEAGVPAWRARKLPGFILGTIVYLVLLPRIGFVLSSLAYVPAMMWHLKVRSPGLLILVPVGLVTFVHFAFSEWLGVNLPTGMVPFP